MLEDIITVMRKSCEEHEIAAVIDIVRRYERNRRAQIDAGEIALKIVDIVESWIKSDLRLLTKGSELTVSRLIGEIRESKS